MKPSVAIVEATSVAQLELVRALFQSYQSELPAACRFDDTEWQTLPGAYGPPRGVLLLATVADHAAGCVGLRPFPLSGACEMKRLYVASDFRGQQLGATLIQRIILAARALGYRHMRLDTHLATMGAAIALYRSFGFVEVPSDPMPWVESLLYMELSL